jgi:hypothetical protein
VPDNTLVLQSGQNVLADAMTSAAEGWFTTPATAVKVTRCDDCSAPVVALNGPKVGATCCIRCRLYTLALLSTCEVWTAVLTPVL